jgi:hypothetical protein
MDHGSLALLIPIMALAIPVCAIVFNGLIKVAKYRAGSAGGTDPAAESRLSALEQEVAQLRGELSETQERLDFTERLLARNAESRRLEP